VFKQKGIEKKEKKKIRFSHEVHEESRRQKRKRQMEK
jgi:hypothetical protein